MEKQPSITAHARKDRRGYVGFIRTQGDGGKPFTESTQIVSLTKADALANAHNLRDWRKSLNHMDDTN
jgi:hypothetical protein